MNEPFRRLTAIAAPLDRDNVDTDLIWPAKPGISLRRGEQAENLFARLRYTPDGEARDDFVLNRAPWRDAKVLVSGRNFGCGSSREMAVWALREWGIRSVIAPSFGDIFYDNACLNGLLPVVLPEPVVRDLLAIVAAPQGVELTVDLEARQVSGPGLVEAFDIASFRRTCLIEGLDAVAATRRSGERIAEFIARYEADFPWAQPQTASGQQRP